jgi:hypothetical protein
MANLKRMDKVMRWLGENTENYLSLRLHDFIKETMMKSIHIKLIDLTSTTPAKERIRLLVRHSIYVEARSFIEIRIRNQIRMALVYDLRVL